MNGGATIVAAIQSGIIALGAAVVALAADGWTAVSFIAGGLCALTGTVVSGMCLVLLKQDSAHRILRAQLVAQAAKIAVALTLLIAALNSEREFAAGMLVAGFAGAVLAYPFALLLLNTKTDRN